ncbi:MAG TPA: SCO family protein [Verrucomicrobiaceae bacterium]
MELRDETGNAVLLSNLLDGKPVLLILADYACAHLCSVVLNGALESARQIRLTAGADYQIVVVSFRPEEKPETAAARHHVYASRYGREEHGGASGWHFLVEGNSPVRKLADAVGFHYVYDAGTKQFAHPSGIVILTPEGRVSRYLQGIDFPPRDLQLALVEASNHRIGSVTDRLLLLCYHYDPTTGKYGLMINRVIRLAGLGTVALLGGMIGFFRWREIIRSPAP